MGDIVETLRAAAKHPANGHGPQEWLNEAADEIERLRAALREAADELDAYYRAEYPGDHPYNQKKLAAAIAANPARAALGGSDD
jgi:hypothetical protein